MDNLKQQKDQLRKRMRGQKGKVEVSLGAYHAELLNSDSKLWASFKPLSDEPVLTNWPEEVEVCWPYIKESETYEMAFSKAESFSDSDLGFLEPMNPQEILKEKISVIFVPGLAFDFKGNRLGRGKGFYDRYLKDFKGIRVGLCSSSRFLEEPIPVDQNLDMPVDYVLTEQFLYKVNPCRKVV